MELEAALIAAPRIAHGARVLSDVEHAPWSAAAAPPVARWSCSSRSGDRHDGADECESDAEYVSTTTALVMWHPRGRQGALDRAANDRGVGIGCASRRKNAYILVGLKGHSSGPAHRIERSADPQGESVVAARPAGHGENPAVLELVLEAARTAALVHPDSTRDGTRRAWAVPATIPRTRVGS